MITKKRKPVTQLVPLEEEQDGLFGFYAGKLVISGDIDSPSIPPEHWNRQKQCQSSANPENAVLSVQS
jgi:antitoxin (DNA-binding transcriptional repressor) of toxin-antitoxin stability system